MSSFSGIAKVAANESTSGAHIFWLTLAETGGNCIQQVTPHWGVGCCCAAESRFQNGAPQVFLRSKPLSRGTGGLRLWNRLGGVRVSRLRPCKGCQSRNESYSSLHGNCQSGRGQHNKRPTDRPVWLSPQRNCCYQRLHSSSDYHPLRHFNLISARSCLMSRRRFRKTPM
jgi:hypothetical protein